MTVIRECTYVQRVTRQVVWDGRRIFEIENGHVKRVELRIGLSGKGFRSVDEFNFCVVERR